ncbi:hypothetical protein WA158_004652 [Blastocystis sp. Blastoise]
MDVDNTPSLSDDEFDPSSAYRNEMTFNPTSLDPVPLNTLIAHIQETLPRIGYGESINLYSKNEEDIKKVANLISLLIDYKTSNDFNNKELVEANDVTVLDNARLKNDKRELIEQCTNQNYKINALNDEINLLRKKCQDIKNESEMKLKDIYTQFLNIQHKDTQYQAIQKKKDAEMDRLKDRLAQIVTKSSGERSNILRPIGVRPAKYQAVRDAAGYIRTEDRSRFDSKPLSPSINPRGNNVSNEIRSQMEELNRKILEENRLRELINSTSLQVDSKLAEENNQMRKTIDELQILLKDMLKRQDELANRYKLPAISTPLRKSESSSLSPINFTPYIGNAPYATNKDDVRDNYMGRLAKFNYQYELLKSAKDSQTIEELKSFLEQAQQIIKEQNQIIAGQLEVPTVKLLPSPKTLYYDEEEEDMQNLLKTIEEKSDYLTNEQNMYSDNMMNDDE